MPAKNPVHSPGPLAIIFQSFDHPNSLTRSASTRVGMIRQLVVGSASDPKR